jgi:hypothetical protein
MDGGQRLSGVTPALHKNQPRVGMIQQNADQFTACISGTSCYSNPDFFHFA